MMFAPLSSLPPWTVIALPLCRLIDGDFAQAEVYDIPVLVGLIGISPLSDVCPILRALPGHVQGFISAPVCHDPAGQRTPLCGRASLSVAAVITQAIASRRLSHGPISKSARQPRSTQTLLRLKPQVRPSTQADSLR